MSSEKEVSFEKFFSMREATKLPEPWRRTSSPSSTRPSIAFLTVMRETSSSAAIWRLRRQGVVGSQQAPLDGLPDGPLQLLVQGLAPCGVQRLEDVGQGAHGQKRYYHYITQFATNLTKWY